ncbi:RHS repeat-associated core domain-containing protein [Flavobacterium indicum]|uniref:RHS repeat-associated core domain-containing protein n=1 Tax=Flavobacterium indicum TaxID=312277 RepID=UPI000308C635|nr:RHS repeat-associated core domain-containing protein [Flavobacterium indicum]
MYKYKYNGKELQDEMGLNMYDYGARNYDPSIGRWMNMDELSEKYTSFSSYNYCVNNPARVIDPDGKQIIYITEDGTEYYYKNNNFYNKSTNERYKYNSKNADRTLNLLLKSYRTLE